MPTASVSARDRATRTSGISTFAASPHRRCSERHKVFPCFRMACESTRPLVTWSTGICCRDPRSRRSSSSQDPTQCSVSTRLAVRSRYIPRAARNIRAPRWNCRPVLLGVAARSSNTAARATASIISPLEMSQTTPAGQSTTPATSDSFSARPAFRTTARTST